MAIKHKRQATRPQTPDPDAIQPNDWNDDHDVEGVLGELADLAPQPNTLPYLNADAKGALAALTPLARELIATAVEADLLERLGALDKTGDAMSGALDMGGNRITGLATPTLSSDAATKAYADAILAVNAGALVFKGEWDASSGEFPGGGVAQIGAFYKVSVAGTVDGEDFSIGDDVFAIADDASADDYAGNWLKIEGSITLAEVQAAVGFVFGSAAALNAGTGDGDLVQIETGGKLPELDGSQLVNLPAASGVTASQITDASADGRSLLMAANYAAMLVLLGIGTAGLLNTGTTANKVLKLDGSAKIPAVDGSQLTNLSGGAPVGAILFLSSIVAPTGWLKANGALLSRTTYAPLWAHANASGNIVAEASWTTNKGAFSTGDTTTTFRLPDLRGIFVRGWDDSAGVDSGRAIGSSQADALGSHVHSGGVGGTGYAENYVSMPTTVVTTSGNTGSTGANETRPKNVALLACIKY